MKTANVYIYAVLLLFCWSCDNKSRENESQPIKQGTVLFKDHYENGKVRIEGITVNGRKNGVWKEYDQDGTIQKAEYYYNDSLVHKLNPLDFVLESNTLADGSTVLLPGHWNIKKDYKQALVIAVKPVVIEPEIFNPTINIVKTPVPDTISLEQIVDLNIEEIKQGVEEFKLKEKETVEKMALPSIKTVYFVNTGGQKLGVLSAYVKDKTALYIITCMAQGDQLQFIKYKDLFEEIILSFKAPTTNA